MENKKAPSEFQTTKPFKAYLLSEIRLNPIVYERLYTASLSVSQRKSLFLTELCAINPFNELSSYMGKVLNENELIPFYTLKDKDDKTLVFESKFECGNLRLGIKKGEYEYDLYLQNDINTQGNNQWFFFRVQNTYENSTVTFNIKNFVIFSNYLSVKKIPCSITECNQRSIPQKKHKKKI